MSDPPVDPRTESDPSKSGARPRPRSAFGVGNVADDARMQPTMQVPITDVGASQWSPAPPSAPPTVMQPAVPSPVYLDDPDAYPGDGYAPDPSVYGYVQDPGAPVGPPPFMGRRPRVRKVSRVLRAIDAWSVFKISLIFYLAMYIVCLVAGVLLWNVAYSTGTIDNISSFFESFGWKSFEFKGGEIYHNAWILGLLLVVGLTGMNVVLATLYNLIADLMGGVRVTVLEEEVVVSRPPGAPDARFDSAAGPGEGGWSPISPSPSPITRWRRRRRVLR
ncbi:MAG: hypothetical protein RL219_748 [Actinomycetota bacterium]|jgi:hypothetical protein